MITTLLLCIEQKTSNKRPIILIPPSYGTNLYINLSDNSLPWYCPKYATNDVLWMNPNWMKYPTIKCFHKLLTLKVNKSNNVSLIPVKNVSFFFTDFGGDDSTRHVVKFPPFKFGFGQSLGPILDFFIEKGYVLKQNLFTAPYDFRLGPILQPKWWYKKLCDEIEKAYNMNNNTRVCIFGFSQGGYIAQYFLSQVVDDEWKQKYIDRLILLSPSYAGSIVNFRTMWVKKSPFLPFIYTFQIGAMMDSWPLLHSHMPNFVLYKDQDFIKGPNGKWYKVDQLHEVLFNSGKITDDARKIYELGLPLLKEAPKSPNVSTTIIYNSAVDTEKAFVFKKWNKFPKTVFGKGDGTIMSDGIEWTCKNWEINSSLRCFDINNPSLKHTEMSRDRKVIKFIHDSTNDDSWTEKKLKFIKKLDVDALDDL